MSHFLRTAAASAMALLCFSAPAAENSNAGKRESRIDYSKAAKTVVTEELRKDLLQFMLLRKRLLLPSQTCVFQTGGVCVIEVPVILLPDPTTPGMQFCVALFPAEFHLPGAGSASSEKTIVWSLTPPSPPPTVGPATFTFYSEPNHGIILLSNGSAQMKGGTLGDGTAPIDATKYMFKHKHKVKNVEAVYLPIVVRTDSPGTASEKVSVCGTPDPKVVSDGPPS